jgi:RNA-directed DNA polymerase
MIYVTLCRKDAKRPWILDADLAGAFDHIDHRQLLACLGTFPARGAIRGWLKAGVMERDQLTPTLEGTPQGGVISPLLLNVALHGMEQAAGVRYRNLARGDMETMAWAPVLVRYADDYVVMCHNRQQAEQVKARLAAWLAPRGLSFNEDKTKIVHLEEGFSFLGCDIARRVDRQGSTKLRITPSQESVRRLRSRLAAELRSLRGANAAAVVARLNPIVRGWTAYYRSVISSRAFSRVDNELWHLTWRWGRHSHPNKSRRWVATRYFGRFNRARRDRWVFGDPETGAYLTKCSWTRYVHHAAVRGWASPDDPTLTGYWAERRRKHRPPPLDGHALRLLRAQADRCPVCQGLLIDAEQEPQSPQAWEQWFVGIRRGLRKQSMVQRAENPDGERTPYRLVHAHCLRPKAGRAAHQRSTKAVPPPSPSRLA